MPAVSRAFGSVATGFPTSVSITSQDVGTGSGRAAYVAIGCTNTNDVPSGVTVGTDSLAAAAAVFTDSSGWRWRIYAGLLTVTGSQTVTATWTDGFNAKVVIGCVVSDVDTGAIVEDVTTGNEATSTSHPTWVIDSATGDLVVALFVTDGANTNTPQDTAAALTGTGLGAGVQVFGMSEAGATSVTINSTLTTVPDVWRGFAFNIPASGGGVSSLRRKLLLGVG